MGAYSQGKEQKYAKQKNQLWLTSGLALSPLAVEEKSKKHDQ